MKILLLKPVIVAKTNGGEISLLERLSLFKSWGADVQILISNPESERERIPKILADMGTPFDGSGYEVDGLRCEVVFGSHFHPHDLSAQKPVEDFFLQEISKRNPDLVVAHYTDYFAVTAALRWNPRKTFVLLTDNEFPRQKDLNAYPNIAEHYFNLKNLVVATQFMRQQVRNEIPWAKAMRVPNPVFTLEDLSDDPSASKDYWLFVNPTQVKGVEFMVELAHHLSDQQFLFVGNWVNRLDLQVPANVKFIPRQNSLQKVFSGAKGLLMPSVWQEAFGRLPLEAMAAGVPVITSDRGALPETVGNGGVVLPLEAELWADAMQRASEDRPEWQREGRERVKQFRKQTERRLRALQRLMKLDRAGI